MATNPKNRRSTPLIVCCSRTGNTRRVADAMATPLAAEVVAIEQLKDHQLRGRPMIGLGSGIYWLRLERRIVDLAAKIPSNCRVFIFSTSGWGQTWGAFYQSELEKRLKQRGIEVIDRWHGPGQDRNPLFKWLGISKGRPNDADIFRAREFAVGLKRRL
jgi:flavodoxin